MQNKSIAISTVGVKLKVKKFQKVIRQGVRYSDHLSLTGILFWVPSFGVKIEFLAKLMRICTLFSEIMLKKLHFKYKSKNYLVSVGDLYYLR